MRCAVAVSVKADNDNMLNNSRFVAYGLHDATEREYRYIVRQPSVEETISVFLLQAVAFVLVILSVFCEISLL